LLTELGLTFGSRIFPKNRSIYLFATVDANYFYSDDGQTLGPEKLTFPQESNIVRNTHEFWPGISAGVKIK
jgi:hypothetical protein